MQPYRRELVAEEHQLIEGLFKVHSTDLSHSALCREFFISAGQGIAITMLGDKSTCLWVKGSPPRLGLRQDRDVARQRVETPALKPVGLRKIYRE
jgi:hypothetical protein